jgi:probable HAF family extracellular repeat protein
MNPTSKSNSILAAALVLSGASAAAQSSPHHRSGPIAYSPYAVTALGTDATAIDALGRVAVNQGTRAYLFVPSAPNASDGNLVPLGTLGGSISIAKSINGLGHVTGYSTLADGHYRGFLWSDGAMTPIGTLGGDYSSPAAIDADGRIVGSSYGLDEDEHGFVWTPDVPNGTTGSMVDLGTLGGEYSAALGLGPRGAVVGFAYTPQGAFRAFLWQDGVMTDLGTLGGSYAKAFAVDRDGAVVGESYLSGNAHAHACRWSGGRARDLGNLGGNYSTALAVDPSGRWIVGDATVPSTSGFLVYHAFVHENGTMTDLNALLPPGSGWVLETASGINENGQIVGRGTLDGQARGFLLTPR